MRRSGKTSFLAAHRASRLHSGAPAESQLLLLLEDERLTGITVADLGWLLEEHARRFPPWSGRDRGATLYLDEVQYVPGWEGLLRRVIDSGGIQVFVTGSSARLLSREVATSLRGRAMEVLIHPFSGKRSATRATNRRTPCRRRGRRQQCCIGGCSAIWSKGAFPRRKARSRETARRCWPVMSTWSCCATCERYAVTNPLALRWLQRQLLANPGGGFSVKKQYDTLRSQGVRVGKDTMHAYLGYLEDAFLVRTVSLHTASERRRMVNPRKAYPVDPGLISLFARSGRSHRGRALETAVLLELERRGWEVSYVRTTEGWEVDFFAHRAGDPPMLVQVCLETAQDATWERELRALQAAGEAYPDATRWLVTLDPSPPRRLPDSVNWAAAASWLLGDW